mgnify:CR=1 FL=1
MVFLLFAVMGFVCGQIGVKLYPPQNPFQEMVTRMIYGAMGGLVLYLILTRL